MFVDVRNRCAERSWDVFNRFLEKTPALNGLYFTLFAFIDMLSLDSTLYVMILH